MAHHDVTVVGGGAAGLMCAITAAKRGRRVVVLEGSNRIGKKILMSGGGRCNFTNLHCEPRHFLSENPRFCISALSRYTPWDFVAMVDAHRIPYHEKTAGQLFCDRSSKDIVGMLQAECDAAGAAIVTQCNIHSTERNGAFRVTTDKGIFCSESLVVASGGLSIPRMGATGLGYQIARQFGLDIIPTRAGLVPFTLTGAIQTMSATLTGLSVPVELETDGASFSDSLLFTHRGLSGPAVLQLSSYWQPGSPVRINLLPGTDIGSWLVSAKRGGDAALVRTRLAERLPRALVAELQEILWQAHAARPLREMADTELTHLGSQLAEWSIVPAGTEGYRTAEVTLGGVDTRRLSSKTMEVLQQPGLFFIGEVVDVTGQLGGFNFQWAWASGSAAGQAA